MLICSILIFSMIFSLRIYSDAAPFRYAFFFFSRYIRRHAAAAVTPSACCRRHMRGGVPAMPRELMP